MQGARSEQRISRDAHDTPGGGSDQLDWLNVVRVERKKRGRSWPEIDVKTANTLLQQDFLP